MVVAHLRMSLARNAAFIGAYDPSDAEGAAVDFSPCRDALVYLRVSALRSAL